LYFFWVKFYVVIFIISSGIVTIKLKIRSSNPTPVYNICGNLNEMLLLSSSCELHIELLIEIYSYEVIPKKNIDTKLPVRVIVLIFWRVLVEVLLVYVHQ